MKNFSRFFTVSSSVLFSSLFVFPTAFGVPGTPIVVETPLSDLLHSTQILESKIDSNEFQKTVDELWPQYVTYAKTFTHVKCALDMRAFPFNDKTMKFTMDKIGTPDANGYPLYIALHGGGGSATWDNDRQWDYMSVYYKDSVKNGVYIAPRGVTDTWDLHFVDESFPLYDRLIEAMVLYEGVDPNRVYLLGFGAGGDGVYQIVPRMADRFAAANMSAGHHNGVNFENLYNTPFLMQIGEKDTNYNRNKDAAENYLTFENLTKTYDGGYKKDLFMYLDRGSYDWRDNDPNRPLASVISNPQQWLQSNNRTSKKVNTNAVDWVTRVVRNPLPAKIVWDLSTRAPRTTSAGQVLLDVIGDTSTKLAHPNELFYWLDVSRARSDAPLYTGGGNLVVEIDKMENRIKVLEVPDALNEFKVLLNENMLDLSKPVVVQVVHQEESTFSGHVTRKVATIARTMLERSDKNFVFDGEIRFNRDGLWTVEFE